MLARLPPAWRTDLGKPKPVGDGWSEAAVYLVAGGRYLKLAAGAGPAAALRDEIARMQYLAAQGICVPDVLRVHDGGDFTALLMTALPGRPASRWAAAGAVPRIAQALRRLHRLPPAACPFDESVATRLARARGHIAAGEIDPAHFADRNRGVSAQQIYDRLAVAVPTEEFVVAHGDATLENIIVAADGSAGFIDCGRCGRADAYLDLAVMADAIADHWGEPWADAFAQAYGAAWDRRKAAFFSDLYELF